jgi:hypothetical protein
MIRQISFVLVPHPFRCAGMPGTVASTVTPRIIGERKAPGRRRQPAADPGRDTTAI